MHTTIGIEFATLEINDLDNNRNIYVQFWDTSGAEKYRAITKGHIRDADGIILVFDLTNKNSFTNLDYWYKFIENTVSEETSIMLMGNKLDLLEYENERLDSSSINEFLEDKKIFLYAECSALNNQNILEPISEFYNTIFLSKKGKLNKNFLSSRRKIEYKKIPKQQPCC